MNDRDTCGRNGQTFGALPVEKSTLKAPFPYFGGKSTVAVDIWAALGNPKHYIEPFFGSGAVLLARPNWDVTSQMETVCDKDGFVANVWRSLQYKPDEVAKWCDWPVNHADLCARKKVLLAEKDTLLSSLIADDGFCNPKLAGYWVWAASCWIGSGLMRSNQRPHIADGGRGVHALGKRPHIADGGMGVHALGKIPHIPHVSNGGQGVQGVYNYKIYEWFRALSERLRNVRVVCGDWKRVCGGDWQDKVGICGIFLDPPYGVCDRDLSLYQEEVTDDLTRDVASWCLERGKLKTYRIVLAGYDEYDILLSNGWTYKVWQAQGGYGNQGDGQGRKNKIRERLYFSPYCQVNKQLEFF